MKITVRKTLSIMLAALLILVTACTLFACNKDKDRAAKDAMRRTESVAVLKDKILGAMDEHWAGELDTASIAALDNAGDYVVAAGWADLICEVLKNSALQTGKLTALKNAVLSENGGKLLEDFAGNTELLIPLMRTADFTPTDISNVTYDLLCALVSECGSAVDAMQARLGTVKAQSGISVAAALNIDECSLSLKIIKRDLVPSAKEKTEMLSAFADAKAPLGEIVQFAYNTSIGSITDGIFNALFSSDGALANITEGEISTVISAFISNAASLKGALDDGALEKLNKAINLIIDKFDGGNGASPLYSQIVQYAKYANMFVDSIPAMCDVFSSAVSAFDLQLISQLRAVAGESVSDDAWTINNAKIAAKIALKIKEDFTAAELSGIIANLAERSTGEYQKAIPLFFLDIALNISTWFEYGDSKVEIVGRHQDIMNAADVDVMVGTVIFSFAWDEAYKKYTSGKYPADEVTGAVSACSFGAFGVENPYDIFLEDGNLNPQWFNYYATKGVEQVNAKALAVRENVVKDINKFISDFYEDGSAVCALIEEISNWQFVTEISDEEYARYEKKALQSDLIGLIGVLGMIFK